VEGRELHIARSDGTEIRKLATPTGSSPYWARWSPDGSRVRFSVDESRLSQGLSGSAIIHLFSPSITTASATSPRSPPSNLILRRGSTV